MPISKWTNPPEEVVKSRLLEQSGSNDEGVAIAAQRQFAKALELPLRKGILAGDVLSNIFERIPLAPDAAPEGYLDVLLPGVEKEHVAYAIPGLGRIPERCVEGDYIMIPTYSVGSSIDWPLKLARNSRWDMIGRCIEIFEAGFVKKSNTDGWRTIITAGKDRNVAIYDANAGAGRLTLRLLSLMQQAMRRNAGGNTTSLTRGRMTDLYMSVEALEDMRNWTVADIDEVTRREIITSENGYVSRIFNINLHDMIEFGVNQEYQTFYLSSLNGTLASGDVELVVGLDLQRNDSFVRPVKEDVQVFNDASMHRLQRAGVYGWMEHGFAVLDNRRVLLGSL